MGQSKMQQCRKPEAVDAENILTKPEQLSEDLLLALEETETELQNLYADMADAESPSAYDAQVTARLHACRRTAGYLIKASQKNAAFMDELSARYRDLGKRRKWKLLSKVPANSVVDLAEIRSGHFAKGLNLYKILLIGYIGSFAGVVIEMLWCLLTRGYLESRAGLVYGPFNLLYGAGAVVMTLALYGFRNKGRWLSFLGGFVVGSVVEYVCSFGQELFFGSRSWDYSEMPFNLNGRICLLYSVFWGVLGVVWVKGIYPVTANLILCLPEKSGKALTWVLLAFFVCNAAVTVIAILRWSQRMDGILPANAFWEFVDLRFPDERMRRIFANMVFE